MRDLLKRIRRTYDRVDRAYKRGYNKVMFSCRHMSRLSSETLDRRLTFRERWTRRAHLLLCKWCRRYDRQMRFLRRNVAYYASYFPEGGSSERLSVEGRERILQQIRQGAEKNL